MAFYLVKAKPRKERLESLHGELNSGKISKMRPFGKSLQFSLENARIDTVKYCFCIMGRGRLLFATTSHGKRGFARTIF
jgi:hypothetical protein